MVRHEAEALPIERGAAAGAEVPPVAGLTILGIDLECAARANHPGIGKIARPAEGAAGAAHSRSMPRMVRPATGGTSAPAAAPRSIGRASASCRTIPA